MKQGELHNQWKALALNAHAWLSVLESSDMILLVSPLIRCLGWIVNTAFSYRGYRLVGLVNVHATKNQQVCITAETMSHLREHFDTKKMDRFMNFTRKNVSVVVLRRVGAFQYSKHLINDLYRQYKWNVLCSKLPTG